MIFLAKKWLRSTDQENLSNFYILEWLKLFLCKLPKILPYNNVDLGKGIKEMKKRTPFRTRRYIGILQQAER